jgi:hypothetical protein
MTLRPALPDSGPGRDRGLSGLNSLQVSHLPRCAQLVRAIFGAGALGFPPFPERLGFFSGDLSARAVSRFCRMMLGKKVGAAFALRAAAGKSTWYGSKSYSRMEPN